MFIRSCTFLTPVTGIKINNTEDLSYRDVIIAFKETIKKLKVKVSSIAYRRGGRAWAQDNRKKISQTMNTKVEVT